MKRDNRVSLVNLGCFKNNVDTEVLAGLLKKKGLDIVSTYEESDWLIINTCGFIQEAKEEGILEILLALEKKEHGEIKYLAVFGCLIQRYYHEFKKNFKGIDLLWGVNDIEDLATAISQQNFNKTYRDKELFLYDHHYPRVKISTPNSNYLKISEGCNMKCSFCSIPKIRGEYRSREINSIFKEAEILKKQGIEELNIISQNSTFFGQERSNTHLLGKLLKELSKTRIKWIRVLYLMPEEVTEQLLDSFNSPHILPYFDLPFQHVAKGVLKSMNRSFDINTKYTLIEKIRKRFKDSIIRSSFIVGYPGETDKDFEELLTFAKETKMERMGVFAYSDEDGTAAFNLKKKIPQKIIIERREQLLDISDNNIKKYNKSLLNREIEFVPIGPSPWDSNVTIGRIFSQAPEVDGFTQINQKFTNNLSVKKVKITKFENETLFGKPIEK